MDWNRLNLSQPSPTRQPSPPQSKTTDQPSIPPAAEHATLQQAAAPTGERVGGGSPTSPPAVLSPFSLPLPAVARPVQGTGGLAQPGSAIGNVMQLQYVAPSGSDLVARTNLLGARVDGVSS